MPSIYVKGHSVQDTQIRNEHWADKMRARPGWGRTSAQAGLHLCGPQHTKKVCRHFTWS